MWVIDVVDAGRAAGFSQRAAVRGGGGSGRIDLPW
jgi:hypothetical protein